MNQESLAEYGMIPLKLPNGCPMGGIRDIPGMSLQEKERFLRLIRTQLGVWGQATQLAQTQFAQHDYIQVERTVTELLENITHHEEKCAKKALSKTTLAKLYKNNDNKKKKKQQLLWTLTEELSRRSRGVSRLRLGNYEGALQDFDMVLEMVSCTEEQPPSVKDHQFAIVTMSYRVQCREAIMKNATLSLSSDTTNSMTTTSKAVVTTLLDHLKRSIGDIQEIFQTAPTAGGFPIVDITPEEVTVTNSTEFYVPYQARIKVLQALVSNKDLERPVFTAEDLRNMETDMGKCLFALGCSYACTHCGASGISPVDNTSRAAAAAGAGAAGSAVVAMKELHLCTGCRRSWFCNRDCQKRAWKQHKLFCGKVLEPLLLNDDIRPMLCQFPLACQVEGQYLVCARDATTGRFFDTITNKDVYFLPSERADIQEVADKLGIHMQISID